MIEQRKERTTMNAKTMFVLMCASAMMALGATAKDSVGGKTKGRKGADVNDA